MEYHNDLSLRKQLTFRDAPTAVSREMTPEERQQKFHTDDVSLPRFG